MSAEHKAAAPTQASRAARWVGTCLVLTLSIIGASASANAQNTPPAPDYRSTSDGSTDPWQRAALTGDWDGLRTKLDEIGLKFDLQEQGELWSNLHGGARRGTTYVGLTTASVTLNLKDLAGWTGATFFVNAYQIHGRGPSANLVGNQQPVSNLEATRDTKLYQLWVEQQLLDGRLKVRVGQEGANDQMMTTQYGALFLNSSFGFPALAAVDLPSTGPNYPLASPFIRAQYQATDRITVVGAVFNADPAPPGQGDPQLRDKGGTAFRLNDHVLAFGELWYTTDPATSLPATYKLGAWYDSGRFFDQLYDTAGGSLANPAGSGIPRAHSTGFAIYGIVDQMVWKDPNGGPGGIGVFLLATGAPDEFNTSNFFAQAGMNWRAPLAGRDNDVLGVGVAYLGISRSKRGFGSELLAFSGAGSAYASNETVFEATYQYQAEPWWTLQPDVQFVANPGAGMPSSVSTKRLKNDVIGGLHSIIIF